MRLRLGELTVLPQTLARFGGGKRGMEREQKGRKGREREKGGGK